LLPSTRCHVAERGQGQAAANVGVPVAVVATADPSSTLAQLALAHP
jgi:hypothetical protein